MATPVLERQPLPIKYKDGASIFTSTPGHTTYTQGGYAWGNVHPAKSLESLMSSENRMMQTRFARQSVAGTDASRIAAMAVAIWLDAGVALSPIIGQNGVAALFKRSVHLTRRAHPCLAMVVEDTTQPDALAALQIVLAQQTCPIAVAANMALLQNFQDVLTSLIGLSLTERLLRPVWDKVSSGQAEQDTRS